MEPSHNRIDIKTSLKIFRDPGLSFSVSSRMITPGVDIVDYLRVYFAYCDTGRIESVFGSTTDFSRLYGGRVPCFHHDLTADHLARLSEKGIGLALTLTNHFFNEQAYRESWGLLETHHRPGNSIVCTNDRLALRLKKDFPLYEVKASIIKNLNTPDKVGRALDLYHAVTLPMDRNDDDEFLESLPEKHRLLLFGNANCAYTCPARTCYLGFAQEIFGKPVTSACSRSAIPRLDQGKVFFDVRKFARMGFSRFKLVPLALPGAAEAVRSIGRNRVSVSLGGPEPKGRAYLCSYRKSGRTWLRFLLAQYLNRRFRLGREIDLHSCFSLVPNDGTHPLKGIGGYGYSGDARFPLVLASHSSYSLAKFRDISEAAILFLVRSVADTLVSDYFQASRALGECTSGLPDFLRDPRWGVAGYCRYLNSWAPALQRKQVRALVLSYEELHRDAGDVLVRTLDFLGIPLDEGLVREAVEASSFSAMRNMEERTGLPGSGGLSEDPEARRMRRGTVGSSGEYLDREDMAYIMEAAGKLLSTASRNLLQGRGLWPVPGLVLAGGAPLPATAEGVEEDG